MAVTTQARSDVIPSLLLASPVYEVVPVTDRVRAAAAIQRDYEVVGALVDRMTRTMRAARWNVGTDAPVVQRMEQGIWMLAGAGCVAAFAGVCASADSFTLATLAAGVFLPILSLFVTMMPSLAALSVVDKHCVARSISLAKAKTLIDASVAESPLEVAAAGQTATQLLKALDKGYVKGIAARQIMLDLEAAGADAGTDANAQASRLIALRSAIANLREKRTDEAVEHVIAMFDALSDEEKAGLGPSIADELETDKALRKASFSLRQQLLTALRVVSAEPAITQLDSVMEGVDPKRPISTADVDQLIAAVQALDPAHDEAGRAKVRDRYFVGARPVAPMHYADAERLNLAVRTPKHQAAR